ncbi:DUF4387 domain-containing protein [Rhodovarius lipocyclicus]|jgi:hypothetical protein|uniref:DUF4387 domain-containing protein n=1 Tax=Rhodovarius lipocyclicus TaxID=268410 RepID=UPI001357CF98|nr:DUF4387 domain-containing protein [Rhodovarius lipocyclicus]
MPKIRDIAQICKSKNAGPFLVTIDILFEDPARYRAVKATGVINEALFARLYGVKESDVLLTPYDSANAFKATLPRLVPAGGIGDTDVYGAQQHAPLLDVEVPINL